MTKLLVYPIHMYDECTSAVQQGVSIYSKFVERKLPYSLLKRCRMYVKLFVRVRRLNNILFGNNSFMLDVHMKRTDRLIRLETTCLSLAIHSRDTCAP